MCWKCDHPEAGFDDFFDMIYDKVLARGWAVLFVESERMPFAYTIGLHECGLPELLITAASKERSLQLLNAAADYCIRNGTPEPGEYMDFPDGQWVEFVEVAQPDAHLGTAVSMFGREVRARQLVWADGNGRWPWCREFNPGGPRQPVLGPRAPGQPSCDCA
ncbi:DUF4262 domain-containing protein [Mycolicibacterium sp. F2034L]|uniref:DUF4262 domain-containing protein n=1 Tax=Mycolicibacterium sp. F2034L TaxID=2926422 RepID=UPI001FF139A4|nr:DUF4262 domain-containing protein [Mycolicibacterium sp. F2034L]MCK0176184.1 DUF4262 domain-containing protein [Mycolicibacterium sp. F2034L]